MLPNEEALVII